MNTSKILCPVDHVKNDFPFPQQDLEPVIDFLYNNNPLPADNIVFPVGTITSDGRLDLCKQQLGVQGIMQITAALKNNQVVKHILAGTNAFGNPGAVAIADLLTTNSTIETVYLGCNYIEQEGCSALCEALQENTSVKSIWLKRNPIGDASIPAIIELLSTNKQLRTLDLVNTNAGEGFYDLLKYLQQNDTIERLYLSGNYLTPHAMKYVSDMLAANTRLRSLYISVNNIGDEGVAVLMPGLMQNNTLEALSLASCGITDAGMEGLFTWVRTNPHIKSLDLGYARSTRVLGAKANELSAESMQQLSELERSGRLLQRNYTTHEDSRVIKSVYR